MNRLTFRTMLQNHGTLYVALGPVPAESNFPPHLRGQKRVVIAVAATDSLALTVYGLSATLRFNGEAWRIFMPWSAILSAHAAYNDSLSTRADVEKRADVIDLAAERRRRAERSYWTTVLAEDE